MTGTSPNAATLRGAPRALHVVFDDAQEPAGNLARDEALLRAASAPCLRLYSWRPTGLSLGHFQHAAHFAETSGTHELVRRPTGGGAIYHEHELTFALALDQGQVPEDLGTSYDLVHAAIATTLAAFGVGTEAVPRGHHSGPRARPEHAWCFAVAGPHDLVSTTSGGKIVGSAQRRLRRPQPRVLHHGSIVLRAPTHPAGCGSVAETLDPDPIAADLTHRLRTDLARALALEALDVPFHDAALGNGVTALAEQLERERYRAPSYTYGR